MCSASKGVIGNNVVFLIICICAEETVLCTICILPVAFY